MISIMNNNYSIIINYLVINIYFISIILLFIYSSYSFILFFFSKKKQYNDILPLTLNNFPFVTIQLPVFNEKNVVQDLIHCVTAIEYPKDRFEIQILDDSTDETSLIISNLVDFYKEKDFNIYHIHRLNRNGYKAGALLNGMLAAKGEFIAIFDADFQPKTSFLLATLPYFINPRLCLVQTRWSFINRNNSFLTKIQSAFLDSHFQVEQLGRSHSGCFINFNGTAGIWRKCAIIDSGNWQTDTVTEDIDLSFRAQMQGWECIYLNDILTPSLLPDKTEALLIQQYRWTAGTLQNARKLLYIVLKSTSNTKQKIEAFFHLTSNVVYPLIVIIALLILPTVQFNNYGLYSTIFNVMSVSIFSLLFTFLFINHNSFKLKGLLEFPLILAASMGLSVNNTFAFFDGLFSNNIPFERTPKNSLNATKNNTYCSSNKLSIIICELLLFVYLLYSFIQIILLNSYAMLPFIGLYVLGFAMITFARFRSFFGKLSKT